MSAETIAIVISAVGLLLGFVSVIGWSIRHSDARSDRIDARIDQLDTKLSARIDDVEARLGQRIDGVERKLGQRIDGVERELVEVKIGLARLEGPPRGILSAR